MPTSLDANYRKVFLDRVSSLGGNQELAKKYLDWMSYLKNVGQDALEKQYPGEKIHGHHALPKYIFKEYEKDLGVMVYIPVSIHYEAHRMLVEIFPKGSVERKAMIISCMGDVKYRMSNGLQVSDEDKGLYDLYKMEIEGPNNPNYGMHWLHLMREDGTLDPRPVQLPIEERPEGAVSTTEYKNIKKQQRKANEKMDSKANRVDPFDGWFGRTVVGYMNYSQMVSMYGDNPDMFRDILSATAQMNLGSEGDEGKVGHPTQGQEDPKDRGKCPRSKKAGSSANDNGKFRAMKRSCVRDYLKEGDRLKRMNDSLGTNITENKLDSIRFSTRAGGGESSSEYCNYISEELKIPLEAANRLGSFILNFHTKKTPKAKDEYFEKISSPKVSETQPSAKGVD